MVNCFAPDCKHTSDKHKCQFFKAPADKKLFKQWEKMLRRKDQPLRKTSRVCSCHFKDESRKNAPTLFKHNSTRTGIPVLSPKKSSVERKSSKKKSLDNPVSSNEGNEDLHFESTDQMDEDLACLQQEINKLKEENVTLKRKVYSAESRLLKEKLFFSFDVVSMNKAVFLHYTGISVEKFNCLYALFENIDLNYYMRWNVECISKKDQLLMFLMKLHGNYSNVDLAFRFNVCKTTVSNVFLTWLHAIHEVLYIQIFVGNGIPSRLKNQTSLPAAFSEYKNTRIILDTTEIRVEIPYELDKKKLSYSNYKSNYTLKALVGIAPNGCCTFCSDLYPGSFSDKEIVEHSKVLEHMVPGDLILADKGFLIHSLLPPGVTLNMPPFLDNPQFTTEQAIRGEKVSKSRVHVERKIKRVKEYKILDLIPAEYREHSTMIFQDVVSLTGLNDALIKEVEHTFNSDY